MDSTAAIFILCYTSIPMYGFILLLRSYGTLLLCFLNFWCAVIDVGSLGEYKTRRQNLNIYVIVIILDQLTVSAPLLPKSPLIQV